VKVLKPLSIAGEEIALGERRTINLPVADLYTQTTISMPVRVINGKKPGPRLFVSAAIHGDELNGVEIIRRLLKLKTLDSLRGTLVAIPIVNIFGLIQRSRYLADRRDLNRSFPGSECGSLAARLANLFMREIVAHCTHGIDLHTGANHRANLPQIRANLSEPETEMLARAFGVPVILNSVLRDGSLREAAAEYGIPMLLYEAGEALRFDELSIRAGVRGIVAVMRALKMLPPGRPHKTPPPCIAHASVWIRAPQSGILRTFVPLGQRVSKGEVLGIIADPFGESELPVLAVNPGIVIGRTHLPLVNEGEALFHLARFADSKEAAAQVVAFQETLPPILADDPPII
jgi:uncharacterized protein